MSPYLRTVKTASGAHGGLDRALDPAWFRDIEHIGAAHDDVELELLKSWGSGWRRGKASWI